MDTLKIKTTQRQHFVDITAEIEKYVAESGVSTGICYLFCPHTTAGITFNENWDPDVQHDISLNLDAIAPQRSDFRHAEGNSPAHVKTSLMSSDHFVFVENGKPVLGRWQGIYFAEFDGPRFRSVYLKVVAT